MTLPPAVTIVENRTIVVGLYWSLYRMLAGAGTLVFIFSNPLKRGKIGIGFAGPQFFQISLPSADSADEAPGFEYAIVVPSKSR